MPFPRSGTFPSRYFPSRHFPFRHFPFRQFPPRQFPPRRLSAPALSVPAFSVPALSVPALSVPALSAPALFRPGTFPPRLFVLLRPFCPACLPPPGGMFVREKALVRVGDRSVVMGREDARSEEERGPLGEGRPARQRREGRLVGRNPVRCGAARSEGRTPGCRRSPAGCISGEKGACGAGGRGPIIQIG